MKTRLGALRLDVQLQGDDRPHALVGPNGSGKSTLLRVLTGALTPDEAEVELGSRVLHSSARGIEVPIERRRVGYVPQGYGLFPHLRAVDNVAFGLAGLPRRERRQRALAMLERLGCAQLAEREPARLSGGERQRVALARALVIEPSLLLLDEPLSALDVGVRRQVRAVLAAHLREAGCPSLVVTHDARDVAALGARVSVLEGGRIVQEGTLAELSAAPASEFVAELCGVAPRRTAP